MFEEETALEKKTSSILSLLLMVCLIVGIVAVALYFVVQSRRVLTTAEATPVLLAGIERQPPAVLRFETGQVEDEAKPEPHYRLLENGGYLKIDKEKKGKTPISLTEKGQAWLGSIAGVKKVSTPDGNEKYTVPLAQRKLVEITKITMETPSRADVEYSWKWDTTAAGDLFDAAGPAVKAFNTWDRTTLIDKQGAAFYHAAPTKVTVIMVNRDKAWEITTE
jgi:hypothetical protein